MKIPKFQGRRGRLPQKVYRFDPKYVPILGTERKCFLHPQNRAVAFELNSHDKSYKRPVCEGCVG